MLSTHRDNNAPWLCEVIKMDNKTCPSKTMLTKVSLHSIHKALLHFVENQNAENDYY